MPEEVKKPVPPAPVAAKPLAPVAASVAQAKPNVQATAPVPPKPAAKPDPTIAQLVTLLDKHGIRFR